MAADEYPTITDEIDVGPGQTRTREPGAGGSLLGDRHARHEVGGRRRIRVLTPEQIQASAETSSCSALDAAAFLALVPRPMSWLKMQDLLYFAQAWHLVWDSELLFPEPIIATEDGVRIDSLNNLLDGKFEVTAKDVRKGRTDNVGESGKKTLSGMVKFYGQRSHYRLSQAIIQEEPWLRARAAGEGFVIDPAVLHRHYRNQE